MLTHWTHWLVLIQVVAIFMMVVGILSQKFSWIQFPGGFFIFGLSLLLLLVVGLVAVIILVISFLSAHPEWRLPSIVSAVVGIAPIAIIILSLGPSRLSVPAIHDITTDFSGELEFTAALNDRNDSDNELAKDTAVIETQQKAYPNIQPLLLQQNPESVFDKALTLVKKNGWEVLREDKNSGEIEAVVETALFGFKDDVIVRIVPEQNGSRVDMRSASRVGRSDLGANQQRIDDFLKELQ